MSATVTLSLPANVPLKVAVREAEKQLISRELHTQGGNKLRTAKALNIGYRTLFEKIAAYGLTEGGVCMNPPDLEI